MKKIIVREGGFIVTNVSSEIITILGSCIAVCLWDRKNKTGGMNHFLLPGDITSAGDSNKGYSGTIMLISAMVANGSKVECLEAKVFGGSNYLLLNDKFAVGCRNTAIALEVLKLKKIPVIAKNIGGNTGRKIIFNTETGKVKVTFLNKTGSY